VLRAIKSQELGVAVEEKPSPAAISKVVDDCKSCIGDEERLRNVIPGVVPIVAPNGPDQLRPKRKCKQPSSSSGLR
jgi:hypothetical protein